MKKPALIAISMKSGLMQFGPIFCRYFQMEFPTQFHFSQVLYSICEVISHLEGESVLPLKGGGRGRGAVARVILCTSTI